MEPCCRDEALIASMTYITARPSAVFAAHCKADLSAFGPRACCIAAPNSWVPCWKADPEPFCDATICAQYDLASIHPAAYSWHAGPIYAWLKPSIHVRACNTEHICIFASSSSSLNVQQRCRLNRYTQLWDIKGMHPEQGCPNNASNTAKLMAAKYRQSQKTLLLMMKY